MPIRITTLVIIFLRSDVSDNSRNVRGKFVSYTEAWYYNEFPLYEFERGFQLKTIFKYTRFNDSISTIRTWDKRHLKVSSGEGIMIVLVIFFVFVFLFFPRWKKHEVVEGIGYWKKKKKNRSEHSELYSGKLLKQYRKMFIRAQKVLCERGIYAVRSVWRK